MVLMESQWLLWEINGCYGKSLDVTESHWLLKSYMVAIESHCLLCETPVSMESHWLQWMSVVAMDANGR
jgi:hypothetical protein